MKKRNELTSEEFLRLLFERSPVIRNNEFEVYGDVVIDMSTLLDPKPLYISGVKFHGQVTIQGRCENITLKEATFFNQLTLQCTSDGNTTIRDCNMFSLLFDECLMDAVSLFSTSIEKCMGLYRLKLKKGLIIDNLSCGEIELICPISLDTISTPMVKTDNTAIAIQFHLAGIPVYISSTFAKTSAYQLGLKALPTKK